MNTRTVAVGGLVLALLALVLEVHGRITFRERVASAVEQREFEHTRGAIVKVNEMRTALGFKAVSATNYFQLLEAVLHTSTEMLMTDGQQPK